MLAGQLLAGECSVLEPIREFATCLAARIVGGKLEGAERARGFEFVIRLDAGGGAILGGSNCH